MHDLLQSLGTCTLLLIPLRVHSEVIGVMAINRVQAECAFSAEEIDLAQTVASEIATAIENVRLYQQAQALAVEQERHRLARELHDSVIQTLYSTVLLASGWRMTAEQGRLDPARTAAHFQQVAEQSEQALKEMRLLLFQLRPPMLEQVGLVSALQQRLDAVEQRVSIETHLLTTGEWDALPPRVEEELYDIAQEALNNALRHAHARSILVRLDRRDQLLELMVEDDGIGFGQEVSSGGMGLRNMQERATEIGAAFSLTTEPNQGTKIQIRVELQPTGDG
jgi:signal transduction histidine kinase